MVNKTVFTYNVTAGVGALRGSYVASFLEQLRTTNGLSANDEESILPYSIITTASNMVVNTMHSIATVPISCRQEQKGCSSYLIPGGLVMSTPWPPTDHEDCPTITIYNAPATQIDFMRNMEQEQMFDDTQDCSVFGSSGFKIGVRFCLAESKNKSDALLAGRFCIVRRADTDSIRTICLPGKDSRRRVPYEQGSSQIDHYFLSLSTPGHSDISAVKYECAHGTRQFIA